MAKRVGINLTLIPTKDWDETLSLAKNGKVHLVSFLNCSAKREEFLTFTEPYFTDPTILVTHVDQDYIADLAGMDGTVVAIPSGTSVEERLRADFPNLKFIVTADERQAFEMVSRRQADLTIRSLTMAAWTIRRAGLSNLKISGQIPGYDNLFRMGVRKDLAPLRDILNKGIATLTPLEIQQVVNRHIAIQIASPVDFLLIIRIVVVFLLATGVASIWIIQLTRMNRRIAQREEALSLSEQRYRQLVESSGDGIVVSQDDYLRFVNPAMTRITDYSAEELLRSRIHDMVHPDDRLQVAEYHHRRLIGEMNIPLYCFRLRKSDGEWIWVEVGGVGILWDKQPATLNFISDISRRKQDEEKIQTLVKQLEAERDQARHSALTDGLTEIPNRRSFDLAFSDEISRFKRSGAPLGLIMIDIDHFKKFNDFYGHQTGDNCLRRIAGAMAKVVGRSPDMVARYGGEEFVVLLPETPAAGVAVVAERLRRAVEELSIAHEASETAQTVTISLGGAVWYNTSPGEPEKLIQIADEALYRGKKAGRNRYEGPNKTQGSSVQSAQTNLSPIVWHDGYACGDALMDQEHFSLFKGVNHLKEAELNQSSREEILSLVKQLVQDISQHFSHEESLLLSLDYQDLDNHKSIHKELLKKAEDLLTLYRDNRISLAEIFHLLGDEIISEHILSVDRKYYSYVHRPDSSPVFR